MNVLRMWPGLSARTKSLWLFTSATLVAGMLLAASPEWVTCVPLTLAESAARTASVRPLHLAILVWCGLITLGVMGTLLYSISSHWNGPGKPRQDVARRMREIAWGIVPLLIFAGAAMPPVKSLVLPEAAPSPSISTAGYRCQWGDGTGN